MHVKCVYVRGVYERIEVSVNAQMCIYVCEDGCADVSCACMCAWGGQCVCPCVGVLRGRARVCVYGRVSVSREARLCVCVCAHVGCVGVRRGDTAAPSPPAPEPGACRRRRGLPAALPLCPRGPWVTPGQLAPGECHCEFPRCPGRQRLGAHEQVAACPPPTALGTRGRWRQQRIPGAGHTSA